MSKERRGFARLYVGVEAAYTHKGKSDDTAKMVLVQDISVSGVRFIATEQLAVDEVLELNVTISGIVEPIKAIGKIAWQKAFSQNFFDTGLEFTEIAADVKQEILTYVHEAKGKAIENREFVRGNLSTTVTYALVKNPDIQSKCISVDICPTGMKLFLKENLKKDTVLHLAFNLPGNAKTIFADGKIVWGRGRQHDIIESGIEFTFIKKSDMDQIADYVRKSLGLSW